MNDLFKRIAIIAAIFIGAVLLMSVAAKVMMNADENDSAELASQTGSGADTEKKTDGTSAGDDLAVTGDPKGTSADAGQTTDAGKDDGAGKAGDTSSDAGASDTGSSADAGQTADAENPGTGDAGGTPSGKHVVVIDAAHQLKNNNEEEPIGPGASKTEKKANSGAEGETTHTPEYQFNLDIALMLRTELEKRGYAVYMIREENDVMISNAERAQIANEKGEIALHIHGGSDERKNLRGNLAFGPSDKNGFLSSSLINDCNKLSGDILAGLEAATGANNHGTIPNDTFPELNWTKIPATRVEIGYLSNEEDDRLLQTPEYRAKIVQGLADGIDRYFGE